MSTMTVNGAIKRSISAPTSQDHAHLGAFSRMLDLIRDRTRSVADRFQVGVYLVGRPGSSKTYTVLETLETLKKPWTFRNSRMSAMGLWCLLQEHPEHTVVLDDVPSLFDQKGALQIVMAALGGSPGKPRTVTYVTMDRREEFQFSGGIIAISNVPLSRDPLADAVASRMVLLEHEPSDEMLSSFMRDQAAHGYEDMTPAESLEVVEFVIAETRACDYRLDLRYMKKAWQDYRMHKQGLALCHWKDLVRSSLKRIVMPEQAAGRSDLKAREQEVARDLFQKYPDDKRLRDKEWLRLTGKTPHSLYRRKRELDSGQH